MVVKNKRGQAALVGLMIGVFIIFLGIGFIDPLKDTITEVRGTSQLDCSNTSISDANKLTCLAIDLLLPYFIVIVFAIGGAWIGAKIIG